MFWGTFVNRFCELNTIRTAAFWAKTIWIYTCGSIHSFMVFLISLCMHIAPEKCENPYHPCRKCCRRFAWCSMSYVLACETMNLIQALNMTAHKIHSILMRNSNPGKQYYYWNIMFFSYREKSPWEEKTLELVFIKSGENTLGQKSMGPSCWKFGQNLRALFFERWT